jgi:hypothetical protein
VPILTIYCFSKMDTVCESYHVLNFFPNKQKVKGQSQLVKGHTIDVVDDVKVCHDDINMTHGSTRTCHVLVIFGFFGMSWHGTKVTHGTLWK